MSIPELAVNPLLERVVAIFDTNKDNQVEFKEFISGLSIFSDKGNKEGKLKFAFQVYDIDGDGYISNGELFQVLKMMVGNNLNDVQLQQIVDKTILEGDLDKDGKISFEEFKKMINNADEIGEKLTISFDDPQNWRQHNSEVDSLSGTHLFVLCVIACTKFFVINHDVYWQNTIV